MSFLAFTIDHFLNVLETDEFSSLVILLVYVHSNLLTNSFDCVKVSKE